MKKVILFITLFSMISLFSYSKNPVKQWGQLQVKGNQLCDQTGDPIVLRGLVMAGTIYGLDFTINNL